MEVWYLGCVLPEGVITIQRTCRQLSTGHLQGTHKLRTYLRLCTYYRMFIAGFSDIAKLPFHLTEEKQTYQWSPRADAAFLCLKELLCLAI